jgi:hypothetical protein
MPVKAYIRGFPKLPRNTLSYMSAVEGLMDDARTNIGNGWTKDDVTFIDSGSFITLIICYGTNP